MRDELPARIVATRTALADAAPATRDRFAAGGLLLDDGIANLLAFTAHYVALRGPRMPEAPPATDDRPHKLPNSANRAFALASGVRAAIAVLACAWLWIASGWSNGGSALISVTIAIALYSVMPQPTTVARNMLIGCAAAWLVGLAFNFAILPRLDGFPLLAVSIAPVIMAGSFIGSFPATAIIRLGFGIYFCFLTNLTNPAAYNPVAYLDSGMAMLLGIAMASLAFATIVPAASPRLAGRYLRQLRRLVADTAYHDTLAGLRLTFEIHLRDFIQYAGTRPSTGPASQATLMKWAFAALEIGLAVIDIREAVARHVMPGSWVALESQLLAAISDLFRRPSQTSLAQALATVEHVIARTADPPEPSGDSVLTRGPAHVRARLHVIRLSLLDDAFPLPAA